MTLGVFDAIIAEDARMSNPKRVEHRRKYGVRFSVTIEHLNEGEVAVLRHMFVNDMRVERE